jgi:type IX secretion system PorP/SprF family membrane protein
MKFFTFLALFFAIQLSASAQDVHFTQQFDNNIYLNPAQSGLGNKANRFVFQYRDQWRSVPVPFASAFLSYDRRIISKNNNLLGGGLQLVYDRAGDGGLSTIKASLSPSYTRYLANNRLGLSVGFQVGIIHRFVDTESLNFESEFDGVGPNNPSGEALSGSVTRPDLGLGVELSSKLGEKNHKLIGGFSMYNFHQPNLSFIENGSDPRPTRFNTYAMAEIFVGDNGWSINPVFHYQRQEKLDNILPTLYAKKYLKNAKAMAVSFGGGYRVDDAAHIYFAYEISDFKVGLNYDINTSSFNDATNTIGAGEILLKYEFERKKKEIVIEELIDSVDVVEEVEEVVEEKDTVETVVIPPVKPEVVMVPTLIEQVNNGINISLFFPNDYPNPRSRDSLTTSIYGDIYKQYIDLKDDYLKIGGEEGKMAGFIDNFVVKEWTRYVNLIKEVRELLNQGKKVTLVVSGHTSPLAPDDYNLYLSKRRVESLYNQIANREYLDKYLTNGQLVIQRVPFGESQVQEGISDDIKNAKESIYSDKAAFERRVEIEKVIIE